MDPEDVPPPVPKEIVKFRAILNEFKRILLDALDDSPREDIQYLQNVKDVTERIHHFGSIVLMILKRNLPTEKEANDQVVPILDGFREMGLDLTTLPPQFTEDCIHYVQNDVFQAPYDLNTSHIDTVRSLS